VPPEAIRALLVQVPFVPFRIHVADVARYDVTDPARVLLCRTVVCIGLSHRNSASEFFDEPVIVANRHITRLEPLVDEVAT
jgi:hypothetical protein